MSNTKKSIVAIVAVIALVSILAVCLCACNKPADFKKRLEKAGYTVEVYDKAEDLETGIEWEISAYKGEDDEVTIIKFAKSADAKKYYDAEKKAMDELGDLADDYDIHRSGSIVISGTKQGVKDAR